jgi:G3E family GTPase
MLQNIPTHVIAGPLGAGKTTLIRHLLAQRPAHERWAVLINEFGLVGLDAALLATADDGIAIGEVAGGCLCCVNGAPFQVGLGRLLRKAKPHRVFIEPSGLGHPLRILEQLQGAPWRGVLAVQPLVMVLDGLQMAVGAKLAESQREALARAGLVVLNRVGDEEGFRPGEKTPCGELSTAPTLRTRDGWISLESLPVVDNPLLETVEKWAEPPASPGNVWLDKSEPVCQVQHQPEGWAIGWRWHSDVEFDEQHLSTWLQRWPWIRAKAVVHSTQGWLSTNAIRAEKPVWRASEWRRDSRLELIFSEPQDAAALRDSVVQALAR